MLSAFVFRPGKTWQGVVPIGLSLWTAHGPVRQDRVIFLDRPRPWRGDGPTDGRVVCEGREWGLVEPGLFETWREGHIEYLRHRALMIDAERAEVVGEYYWLDTRELSPRGAT